MSPAKTPKKSAEDDFEAVSMNKEVQKLKTGNTVTPKKNAASKLTIDNDDSGGTPTRKITRKLKTPSKDSVEQTNTLNTPKGNLGDPSPLQTRSARKKKAALGQNATPKLISPFKSETPSKAEGKKSSRKPTPGRPIIKQEPKSDEDVGENELDSDDLDSDDVDEEEDNADQKVPHKMEPKPESVKQKETPKKKTEMVEEVKLPEKAKMEKVDSDLEEAAQTPLPMSPEAPAAPQKQTSSTDLSIKTPKGVNKNQSKKSETDSPKVKVNVEIEEAKDDLHSKETSQDDAVTEQSSKSPGKRTKKQKDGNKKAKKSESDTDETTAKIVEQAVEIAAAESVPVTGQDVPEVALSETEIPTKSPGKRTKGPNEVAKKAKLAETSAEEILDGKSSASSEESTSPRKKATSKEQKVDSISNLKVMSKGNASDEEKIEKLRQQLIDAGKDTSDIEVSVRRFRRVLMKRLQVIRCKRCLQRGHSKQACPNPPRANNCYKCGIDGHKAAGCSIKAAVFTYAECDICRKTGHLTKFCPDKKLKPAKAPEVAKPNVGPKCYKCGERDHNMFTCSIKEDIYPFAKCRVCRKVGHLFKDCPTLEKKRMKKLEKASGESAVAKAEGNESSENSKTTAGDEVPTKKSRKGAKIQTNANADQKEEQAESVKKSVKKEHTKNAEDQKESVVSAKKKKKAKKSTEEVKENVTAPTEVGDLKNKKKKNKLLSTVNEPEVNVKSKAKAAHGEPEVKKSALKMGEPTVVKKVSKKQKVKS